MMENEKFQDEELIDDTVLENEATEENGEDLVETVENQEQSANENAAELSETEKLLEENKNLQGKLDDLKDKYTRLTADFDNFRRRTAKEKIENRLTAAKDIMTAMLDVMDDFDRAESNQDVTMSEGMQLTVKKFRRIMKDQGLQEMESTNMDFDPDLHEAVTKIPAQSEEQKGKVYDTVQKGYFLNDTIIRHAKVVVGQ